MFAEVEEIRRRPPSASRESRKFAVGEAARDGKGTNSQSTRRKDQNKFYFEILLKKKKKITNITSDYSSDFKIFFFFKEINREIR